MVMHGVRLAALAAAAAFAAPQALAFECGPERIAAAAHHYNAMLNSATPDPQMDALRSEIVVAAKHCPETGWLQIIAAGAEIKRLERREAAPGTPSPEVKLDRFAYVERAAGHLMAFRDHYPEDFQYGAIRLAYSEWSGLAESVVHAMLRYAADGYVQPLVSDNPPPLACDYVTKAMATSASNFRFVSNPASLTFLTTVADICRPSPDPLEWGVLVQRSNRLVRLVETGGISNPDHIRWALREAYRDSRQFLQGHEPPRGLWFESNERSLQAMLEKHQVDLGFLGTYKDIPQADWFKPEHVGTEDVTYSMALAISRMWTPLAAGITDAEQADATRERGRIFIAIMEMGKAADEAGQTVAGRQRLIEALNAFQRADVRTPETASLPPPPGWLVDTTRNAMQRAIDEAN